MFPLKNIFVSLRRPEMYKNIHTQMKLKRAKKLE